MVTRSSPWPPPCLGLAISVAGLLQAGALAGMAIAGIVVLCMSGNYVVVRHRRDVSMAPAIWLAGVISALVALPFAEPANVTWQQVPLALGAQPRQPPAACCSTWQA